MVRFMFAAAFAALVFLGTMLAGAAPPPAPPPTEARLCRTFHGPWAQTVDEHGRTVLRRPSRTVCVGPVPRGVAPRR